MSDQLSPIIQAADLLKLYQTENLVIVDVSGGINARDNYEAKHLAGALYVDLNTQLANIQPDLSKGGRHPLPEMNQFSETLTCLGITPRSHVILYDDKNGSNAAARFWWMLQSVGHQKVQVLNGGLPQAEKAGFPISSSIETPAKVQSYPLENWALPVATMQEVEAVAHDKNYVVMDVRDSERFKGITEPIDLVAGHIPGAVNVPFTTNLDANGLFLSPAELRARYQEIMNSVPPENTIVHCGSGVTACHTLLALVYAGYAIPKLYVGSWSEWSRNNKGIATIHSGPE